ncbi:AraC family transcriptional regulator [Catellatospora tritici]|uniref:AraC family transcriptional regulator n=1 Tax=Catellatospora tritici TaxID=2851566 RepID=UPI001C2DC0F2|nr:AraC family transcriptional regulator [Catellatospora tritici]MBV1850027.1 AraC family transcriptional regulator [Catellatospora tritici]
MTDGEALRVQSREFTTRDMEVAHQVICDTYTPHRPRVLGGSHDFRFQQHVITAGELSMSSVRHTASVETVTHPLPYLLFGVSLNAELSVQAGREEVRPMRGDAYLSPTGVPLTVQWTEVDVRLLWLPVERVARVAARSGVALADFRFLAMTPVSREAGRQWRATMAYLFQMLNEPDTVLANPLVHAAAVDLAAAAAIGAFPNTATTAGHLGEPGRVAPAALRRAVAFVDAHAHQPVTVEDIADAAGLSCRALQTAFSRHVGTTPMAYLRRVRLERAHRDLQAADPTRGATVADVARRWGFTSLSRFAAVYQQEYGRSPRHTLRT